MIVSYLATCLTFINTRTHTHIHNWICILTLDHRQTHTHFYTYMYIYLLAKARETSGSHALLLKMKIIFWFTWKYWLKYTETHAKTDAHEEKYSALFCIHTHKHIVKHRVKLNVPLLDWLPIRARITLLFNT